MERKDKIKARAAELGFCKVGFTTTDDLPRVYEETVRRNYPPFLAKLIERGSQPRLIAPEAHSIIVLAYDYSATDFPENLVGLLGGRAHLRRRAHAGGPAGAGARRARVARAASRVPSAAYLRRRGPRDSEGNARGGRLPCRRRRHRPQGRPRLRERRGPPGLPGNRIETPPRDVFAFYCGRGAMELVIGELKEGVLRNCVQSRSMAANEFRCLTAILAYSLLNWLRRLALPARLARGKAVTLRSELVKVAARKVSHGRRVLFRLPSSCPRKAAFYHAMRRIWEMAPG